ncbi:hypothetical protein [Cryomorpha ignava]|uniref:hypothetical protein n=1 Tax=Cryomorpha ignava TaxID=101383 RepID=UPI001953DCA3|nr:hypothetical protein [Cryomorpha ignava]
MKNFSFYQAGILLVLLATLNGCSVIGDIFEAGLWVGVIVVVVVIVLIIWIIKKMMS